MRTHRRRWALAPALAIPALAVVVATGQARQDPGRRDPGAAERIGQRIDRFLKDAEANFRDLSSEVRRRFAEARERVDDLGVEARVYSRLHWDKALEGATLAVEARESGEVVLHGTVADADARQKAVRLAADTVGVERVVDRLEVLPPPAETPVERP